MATVELNQTLTVTRGMYQRRDDGSLILSVNYTDGSGNVQSSRTVFVQGGKMTDDRGGDLGAVPAGLASAMTGLDSQIQSALDKLVEDGNLALRG